MPIPTFKRSLARIAFSLVLVLACRQSGYGCGGYYLEENDYAYLSFFDLGLEFGQPRSRYFDADELIKDPNVAVWKNWTGSAAPDSEVVKVLYELETTYIVRLLQAVEKGGSFNTNAILPYEYRKNPFIKTLCEKKNLEALRYLTFAKEIEPFAQIPDPWSEDRPDFSKLQRYSSQARQAYSAAKDEQLKLRYGYQVVRLNHYRNAYAEAIAAFNELIEPLKIKRDFLYYRAKRQLVGLYRKTNQREKALLLVAELMEKAPETDVQSDFHFLVGFDELDFLKRTIANAPNVAQKAALWRLHNNTYGESTYDLAPLENLYALAPNSPDLETVLVTEIADFETRYLKDLATGAFINEAEKSSELLVKQERGWWESVWLAIANFFRGIFGAEPLKFIGQEEFEDSAKENDEVKTNAPIAMQRRKIALEKVNELKRFTVEAAQSGKVLRPGLWYLAAAYTALLTKNLPEAANFADEAAKDPKLSEKLKAQAELTKNLVALAQAETMTVELEDALHKSIEQAGKNSYVAYAILNAAARKYLATDNLGLAFLAFLKADKIEGSNDNAKTLLQYYFNDDQTEKVAAYLKNPSESVFAQFLQDSSGVTGNDVLSLLGQRFLFRQDFKGALAKFKRVDSDYWTATTGSFYGREFLTNFQTNEFVKKGEDQKLNLLNFAQKLVELEDAAAKNRDSAPENYLQIGNAFYALENENYGWDGEHSWIGYGSYSMENGFYPFDGAGISDTMKKRTAKLSSPLNIAENYYEKAMTLAKDNSDTGARACLMAHFSKNHKKTENYDDAGLLKWEDTKYYAAFDKFRGTKFYDKTIRTCPTLAHFLRTGR